MTTIELPIRTVAGLNAAYLRAVFEYEPDTGMLRRVSKTGQNVKIGIEAGWIDRQGYRRVRVHGSSFAVHRVVWTMVTGSEPVGSIDHLNGVRNDNRISNLRDVSRSTNLQNQRHARSDNRMGVLGVRKVGRKFEARIWVDGKNISVGLFETTELASDAYVEAKRIFHEGCTL